MCNSRTTGLVLLCVVVAAWPPMPALTVNDSVAWLPGWGKARIDAAFASVN